MTITNLWIALNGCPESLHQWKRNGDGMLVVYHADDEECEAVEWGNNDGDE